MYESLTRPEPDKILSLMAMFRDDPRPGKMDLGVGVYRDPTGRTPILAVVRRAEAARIATEVTKSYVGPAGDPVFVSLVRDLAFGPDAPRDRLRGIQTVGGAGALRVLAGLIARARPGTTVHLPDPTWVNHDSLLTDARLATARYRYFDRASGRIDVAAMLDDIAGMAAGDVILLHGCCHNPTGADPGPEDWQRITDAILAAGAMPLIDLAYQGFGGGLDTDAAPLRLLAASVPEMAVAYSCSKNFGIYRDRAGAAFLLGRSPEEAEIGVEQLTVQSRIAYSMPPDHGAALVRDILSDRTSAAEWRSEVDAMRRHIVDTRNRFVRSLKGIDPTAFSALEDRKGMFALLPLSPEQVGLLRKRHGIYMVSDGRINLAGLRSDEIARLAEAIATVS